MIQVKKSIGLHTIQDKGRVGYQSFGVPVSGPMDEVSFIIANYLVLNEDSSSVIELSSGSLSLLFSSESVVAATGFAIVRVNGIGVPLWRPIYVSSGDVLDIQLNLSGNFAYLSIAGGWKSELWLGSTATYLPLGVGKLIKQGAILTQLKGIDKRVDIFAKYLKSKGKKYDNWGVSTNSTPPYSSESIQLMRGMEINSFTKESLVLFTERKYKIAHEKNRMAYVIEDAMLESVDSK